MILFCDFETNGINPYGCEILTGYFELHKDGEIIDSYSFKSQIDIWCDESALVHKINYDQMLTFPAKKDAMQDLVNWIKGKEFFFACYARPQQMNGYYFYDFVVLKMSLGNYKDEYLYKPPFKCTDKIDIYTMAKDADSDGYFKAISKPGSNRKSFTQENVYKALFDESYESHDAYHDVQAMSKIYYELRNRIDNNIYTSSQGKLI